MTWVHKLKAVVSLSLWILGTIVLITGMLLEIAPHGRGAGEAAAPESARRAVIAGITATRVYRRRTNHYTCLP